MKKKIIGVALIVVLVASLAFVLVENPGSNTTPRNKLSVTASFYPLYNFAQEIGGDKVKVTNITPAGAEPHDFEPSPKQLVEAKKSQVFIYDGGTLEPWAKNFLSDYHHISVKASSNISLHKNDPHFWLDPILVKQIVANIKNGFTKADPEHKTYFAERAKAYEKKLAALDKEYRSGLKNCRLNTIITSHKAFSYLAQRYNFAALSIAGLSPDEEPSPAKLAELSRAVKMKKIKYIFFETLTSPRLARTIAQETGAKTLVFNPIEGLSKAQQNQGENYLSIQRKNLANLQTALACQ